MLLIAQAPQDEILAAFAPLPVPDDPARMWSVGPTAPSGWTAAWVEEEAVLPESWDLVLLGEIGDPRVVRVRSGGSEQRFAWDAQDRSIPAHVPAVIAETLRMPGAVESFRSALEEHLLGETTTEEEDFILAQVAGALSGAVGGLPQLENDTYREILLDRGDASRRRRLAEEFAHDDEGWVLTELGADWFSVHSPDIPELIQWNTGWVEQIDDSAERAAAGDALDAAFGPVAGQRRLRELCSAQTVDGDPIARLLELLNIPRTALLVLDDDPSAPEPTVIEAPVGLLGGLKRLFGGRG